MPSEIIAAYASSRVVKAVLPNCGGAPRATGSYRNKASFELSRSTRLCGGVIDRWCARSVAPPENPDLHANPESWLSCRCLLESHTHGEHAAAAIDGRPFFADGWSVGLRNFRPARWWLRADATSIPHDCDMTHGGEGAPAAVRWPKPLQCNGSRHQRSWAEVSAAQRLRSVSFGARPARHGAVKVRRSTSGCARTSSTPPDCLWPPATVSPLTTRRCYPLPYRLPPSH